jgi:ribosome recycling factor
VSGKKTDLTEEDLMELYDLAWRQFKEDRELIVELYTDLKTIVKSNPERYALSGDTLGKYAELLTKQTAQVVELLKVVQKQKEKDESLSAEDYEQIGKVLAGKDE